ncbi:MAG: hypothetical protein E6Q06_01885 [Candidatus Moraniibacteriota bacterium]|nr:MAG: hypothetical protein E6Q06_01885 [Candidatus Moranbacteria bacterium]
MFSSFQFCFQVFVFNFSNKVFQIKVFCFHYQVFCFNARLKSKTGPLFKALFERPSLRRLSFGAA